METCSSRMGRSNFVETFAMIREAVPRKDLSRSDRHRTTWAAADHDLAPPVMARSRRYLFLPLAGMAGLALLPLCVSVLVKWNVPLPRCAFKTVTGLPCFTCG